MGQCKPNCNIWPALKERTKSNCSPYLGTPEFMAHFSTCSMLHGTDLNVMGPSSASME
ncbi:hypothetical protein P7K49_028879 [Saguinus oedipus]|uniref:Uncharacterized protein n=1 Tax=Saguinus oedipus TaxID=9490 RepID=A0ABQ9U5M5_SAGOE|nr:hypothetical protein P7K49_028879 [Saguinus oedipus]